MCIRDRSPDPRGDPSLKYINRYIVKEGGSVFLNFPLWTPLWTPLSVSELLRKSSFLEISLLEITFFWIFLYFCASGGHLSRNFRPQLTFFGNLPGQLCGTHAGSLPYEVFCKVSVCILYVSCISCVFCVSCICISCVSCISCILYVLCVLCILSGEGGVSEAAALVF